MGREKKAQEAKEALFKRLYGVKPATFNQMLSILQKEFNEMHKSGEHDFTVYKDTIGKEVSNSIPIDADLGYLGIKEYHANSFIPVKSSKNISWPNRKKHITSGLQGAGLSLNMSMAG
jgi:hypothetical protein